MKTSIDKNFEIPLIVFLISSIACPILFVISKTLYFIDLYILLMYLFCVVVASPVSLIICTIFAITKVLKYEKRKKLVFAAFVFFGAIVTVLAIYLSKLNIQEIRIASAVGLSTLSAPLQVLIIFIVLFIMGGIVAGTHCERLNETWYWVIPMLSVCLGGMLGVMISVDLASYINDDEMFIVYHAALPLCCILFCWTAWVTIKIRQTRNAKWIMAVKTVLCAIAICITPFLSVTHGLTRIGQGYRKDNAPRIYDGASDIEQIQVFLSQKTGEKSNDEILGWDIEDPTTWDGVAFDGSDIISIDLKGRGIGGRMELIYFDKLKTLDISDNPDFLELDCRYNKIEKLDVSGCIELRTLNCGGNRLETIDVSDNINLERFSCRGNLLTSLDVSNNTGLVELYCYDNLISELDLSNNRELVTIYCGGNPISSIDVSGLEKLIMLNCDDSENLSVIDVNGCPALKYIHCWNTKVNVKNIQGIRSNISLLVDYKQGYVAYARSTEKQIVIIAIILAIHLITDIAFIAYKRLRYKKIDN